MIARIFPVQYSRHIGGKDLASGDRSRNRNINGAVSSTDLLHFFYKNYCAIFRNSLASKDFAPTSKPLNPTSK